MASTPLRKIPSTERASFSVDEIAARNGVSRSHIFGEIAEGRLEACKSGRRTLITPEAEQAWLAALPRREITAA